MGSFITYAGSKKDIIDQISPFFELSNKKNFFDAFCGGGSVTSYVASNKEKYSFEKIVASDINSDLIGIINYTLSNYKEFGDDFFDKLYDIIINMCPKTKEEYYSYRAECNKEQDLNLRALNFLTLSSCCTNNMVRYNRKGEFNATYGERKFNTRQLERIKQFCHDVSDKASFITMPYTEVVKNAKDGLVYLDPPYSASGVTYTGWNKDDDNELASNIKKIIENGNDVVVSSFIKNEVNCPLNEELSKFLNLYTIDYGYTGAARKKDNTYQELLFTNLTR